MGPKGIPHTYLVRSERAKFLATFTPAGTTEGFFAEVGIPVIEGRAAPRYCCGRPQGLRAQGRCLLDRDRRTTAVTGLT